MFLSSFTYFLLFVVLSGAQDSPCDVEPIVLPLTDVQVVADIDNSIMRGIPTTIGTPPQNILLLPWPDLNNTWIYDNQPFCDESIIFDDSICLVRRGSFYLEKHSTTFAKTRDIISAGGAPREISGRGVELGVSKLISTSLAGTERITIGSHEFDDSSTSDGPPTLTDFPVGIPRLNWDHGYTTLHALGLGSNSTYLNALVEGGHLAVRAWSLFWGRMWIDDPIDGSLILGGYDRNKLIGQNHTQNLDYDEVTGCWTGMKVTLSDVQVNFRNGEDKSLFPPNLALPCCIVPQRQLLLEAPAEIQENFGNVTGMKKMGESFGLHWSAALYEDEDEEFFDGDLTLHLSTGLQIRIPNSQFLPSSPTIRRGGSLTINTTRRDLLINALHSQPATLGRYFLTSTYLSVNHDAGTFSLWQANPSRTSDIVAIPAVDGNAECITNGNNPTDSDTGDGNNNNNNNDGAGDGDEKDESTTPDESTSLPTALLAAIIAGTITLSLSLAALSYYLYLRHQKRKNQNPANPSNPPPYREGYPRDSNTSTTPGTKWRSSVGKPSRELEHPLHPQELQAGVQHLSHELPAQSPRRSRPRIVSSFQTRRSSRAVVYYEVDGTSQSHGAI